MFTCFRQKASVALLGPFLKSSPVEGAVGTMDSSRSQCPGSAFRSKSQRLSRKVVGRETSRKSPHKKLSRAPATSDLHRPTRCLGVHYGGIFDCPEWCVFQQGFASPSATPQNRSMRGGPGVCQNPKTFCHVTESHEMTGCSPTRTTASLHVRLSGASKRKLCF